MSGELKPCQMPWCDGDGQVLHLRKKKTWPENWYSVACTKCSAMTGEWTLECDARRRWNEGGATIVLSAIGAIAAWNRRAPLSPGVGAGMVEEMMANGGIAVVEELRKWGGEYGNPVDLADDFDPKLDAIEARLKGANDAE